MLETETQPDSRKTAGSVSSGKKIRTYSDGYGHNVEAVETLQHSLKSRPAIKSIAGTRNP